MTNTEASRAWRAANPQRAAELRRESLKRNRERKARLRKIAADVAAGA